jgi:lipopolysaccharide/colanic/teichoic acid biosynthesis glycosyltransferase
VFFCQIRVGAGGRHFRMYKFRTMTVDAESRLGEVRHLNIHAATFGDTRLFKGVSDPRITPFGARLRRFSLDELPQLLNVLKGEMSLVGPRPLELDEDRYVVGDERRRLEMRPGITGLWQVLGRNALSFDEMLRLDLEYVSRWRLRDDLLILLRTLPAMLDRQEAP